MNETWERMGLEEQLVLLKDRLRQLWHEEGLARNRDQPEPMSKTLERHTEISEKTGAMLEVKRQQRAADPGVQSQKVITGSPEYGEPALPSARLELKRVAFNTTFDVCSDDVADFSDYRKFYILEDSGNYYHWLKTRTNPDDALTVKPAPIPITFASSDAIEFTATFEVISAQPFTTPPTIRVTDKADKYVFADGAGQVSGEFEVTFRAGNLPYDETIQYLPGFELVFDYSEDGASWVGAGSCINDLYLTWRTPIYDNFAPERLNERTTMRVQARFNSNTRCILESILRLGCEPARGLGNSTVSTSNPTIIEQMRSEIVIDAIFSIFRPLELLRAREGTPYLDNDLTNKGLGYWRDTSASDLSFSAFRTYRSLRYLLQVGEARCGEFAAMLYHLALCQGIKLYDFVIFSPAIAPGYQHPRNDPRYYNGVFLVKGWSINDPMAPVELPAIGNKAQGNTAPQHFFWDHVFCVLQTNQGMKYYDPSYGIQANGYHTGIQNLLNDYASVALEGIVYGKEDANGTYFLDVYHSNSRINILGNRPVAVPYLHKVIQAAMADHLIVHIYEPNVRLVAQKTTVIRKI